MPAKRISRENVSSRPAEISDEAFLEKIYADSRRDELILVNWSREQEDAFFKMQFQMQRRAYEMQFPGVVSYVIELDKIPIGRLLIYRHSKEIRLVDIALLAEFSSRGIGEILLKQLKTEVTFDKPLNLHVLKTNRAARRFYERLGFTVVEDGDLHISMQWRKS